MAELNRANRQCCDVDIRFLKNKKPFIFFDTANTTTFGLSADQTFARAKGSRRIGFPNEPEGSMQITAQVYPLKLLALMSNGKIENTATIAEHKVVKGLTGGTIDVPADATTTTTFVYPKGFYGDESAVIEGTVSGGKFTATTSSKITADAEYEVAYFTTKGSDVKRVSFAQDIVPEDYFITMYTVDKDEEGNMIPFIITAYKATVSQNMSIELSSDGDPATLTLDFSLLQDKEGRILDLVEDYSSEE